MKTSLLLSLLAAPVLTACPGGVVISQSALPGVGPNPELPPPAKSLLPTISIAPAAGWPPGVTPRAPAGFKVTAFATGLEHPRWVYTLPNGDVLVAESNKPPPQPGARNVHAEGLRGKVMELVMKRAGAGPPSANRITLLRDADGTASPKCAPCS